MDTDGPLLVETGGALNIRYQGRLLYPERGPLSLPARLALACETGPDRLHLVSSPGLWYGVEELLSRLGPGSAVLCVEADPLLARLSRERRPAALAGDPRLAFAESAEPAALLKAAAGLGRFRRCLPLRLSGGAAFHERAYAEAAAILQAEFAAFWRSKAALLSMGRLWARNIFRNLSRVGEMGPEPLPRFEGTTIVCGAGPSLEASLGLIAAERRALTVVACDTALPPLVAAGIEPDLVVCLEGQAHNLPDFVPAEGRPIGLLADLSSHPSTFRALSGPRFLSLVSIARGPFLERLAALPLPLLPCPPLGSVGVHAVHVARRLSSGGPVLVTGLDFAYGRCKTHARGAPSLLAENAAMRRLSRWPRQAQSAFRPGVVQATPPLLTDPALSAYAALLADEIAQPGPEVLDLREGGLPIGARRISDEEARALIRRFPAGGTEPHFRTSPPAGAAGMADAAGTAPPADTERPVAAAAPAGTAVPVAGAAQAAAVAAAVQGFLSGELARLDAIYESMKGRGARTRAELASMIADCDYLLWPLADDNRLPGLPQDLANRLLVEVEYWSWKLRELVGPV